MKKFSKQELQAFENIFRLLEECKFYQDKEIADAMALYHRLLQ
jgi:hypothetical protein